MVERAYYSPVPEVPAAESPVWHRPRPLVGFEVDTAAAVEHLESTLAPHLAEFCPPIEAPRGGGAVEHSFHLWNGLYEAGDAEVLYAMLRERRPRRVLELGAGWSTLVSSAACAANERDGRPAEHVAYDPAPRISFARPLSGLTRFERRSAVEVPLECFRELEAGDVLFVDTSHTVKLGSEVNFLILEVLPRLAPGVLVHFHDIFTPYEYPRAWFEESTFVAEQYMLEAFLVDNPRYGVILPLHALWRERRMRLEAAIPSLRWARSAPSAFWLERRA